MKQPIPIRDLNLEITLPKQTPQREQQKAVALSGGFKIPQSVIDDKKNLFAVPEKPIISKQPTQMEIFEGLGLQPITNQQAKKQKQDLVISALKDHPIAKSQLIDETRKLIITERKDIQAQMDKFAPIHQPEDPDQASRLQDIESQINNHYSRLHQLEKQFIVEEDDHDDYHPDNNVWEKVEQLRNYRKSLKNEQKQAKQEYEAEQRKKREVIVTVKPVEVPVPKKDPFIEQQIQEHLRQKELNKNRPRSKPKEDIKPKSPERQIYEHQFEEYKKDKDLQRMMEIKSKEFQQQDFERYRQKDKERIDIQINQRAIAEVKTLDELHKLQVQVYKDEQIDKLDVASKKSIFKSLLSDKLAEKNIENEKNENFVLKYSFQQIDKDLSGFVSKGEVLEYLLINRDIQIIFDLDIKQIDEKIQQEQTHRKGMMDFTEFSKFVKRLHLQRKELLEKFKNNAQLQEQNQEETLQAQFLIPIKEVFKILDFKEQGVLNRTDLIRSLRNDLSKKNTKLLQLPISTKAGSPSVNQVLEKILADYRQSRNKKDLELISLKQLLAYFEESMPYDQIQIMQARIILAHFGPGSIASEGYYNKIKNRCVLNHASIHQLLQCFMKLDTNCELIVEKTALIDKIRQECDVDVIACTISQIGKSYTLDQILLQLEQSIKQIENHDSHFISLQQFTDYLTNFTPALQKLPVLYFPLENEQKPKEDHFSLSINSTYFQIIKDVFDMVPRVFAHFILKEEFIAVMKNDPQTKFILQQVGRAEEKATINQLMNKLQKMDIDFISWLDIIHLFALGDIPKEDYQNKLPQKPAPMRAAKLYDKVLKGNPVEEELFDEVENLSFDDMQIREMKSKYDTFQTKSRKSKSLKKLTVPKDPNFKPKKKTIRERKLEEMVREIQSQEEFELNNKFKANPMPPSLFVPVHNQQRFNNHQPIAPNPPSFYERDFGKFIERKQLAEDKEKQKIPTKVFKAKEVPMECNLEVLKKKEQDEKQRKMEQKEKRKQELISNTIMPKGLQEDEQKRKEKKAQIEKLKPHEIDKECQFNPKINKNFVSKREDKKKEPAIIPYMDEDNQRNKKPESPRERTIQSQQQDLAEQTLQYSQLESQLIQPEQDQQPEIDQGGEEEQVNSKQEIGSMKQQSIKESQNKEQSVKEQSIKEQSQKQQPKEQSIKYNSVKDQAKPIKKKEREKPMSTADREQIRLKEEKEKMKKQKEDIDKKLDPNYLQKKKEMEERIAKRPLMNTSKQHGSSKLDELRRKAKEASLKQENPQQEDNIVSEPKQPQSKYEDENIQQTDQQQEQILEQNNNDEDNNNDEPNNEDLQQEQNQEPDDQEQYADNFD